uniref:Uncharacterized protein n=1 Tax=Megaselia scalaris TaxID=36166 RepID=T1GAY6_MEGSC
MNSNLAQLIISHVFVTPAPTNTYIPPVPQTLKSETFSTGQVQTNTFLPQVKANLSPPPTSFTSSQNSYSSQPSGQESFNLQQNSFDQQLTFNVQQPQQAFNVQQQETPLQNTFNAALKALDSPKTSSTFIEGCKVSQNSLSDFGEVTLI